MNKSTELKQENINQPKRKRTKKKTTNYLISL